VVYAGNLLGGYLFGYIMSVIPGRMDILENSSFEILAAKLNDHSGLMILGSGLLAGWLMGLLSWLITSARETISRIFIIVLITSVIGIGGLHHCIVGSVEMFTALLTGDSLQWSDYFRVQGWSTLGNIIGGVFFVAVVKFSHVAAKPD